MAGLSRRHLAARLRKTRVAEHPTQPGHIIKNDLFLARARYVYGIGNVERQRIKEVPRVPVLAAS